MWHDWIAVPTLETVGEYPDFRMYGFHTGRKVEVRFADGKEDVVIYQGYGMFGENNREDVTHWRPSPNVVVEQPRASARSAPTES